MLHLLQSPGEGMTTPVVLKVWHGLHVICWTQLGPSARVLDHEHGDGGGGERAFIMLSFFRMASQSETCSMQTSAQCTSGRRQT